MIEAAVAEAVVATEKSAAHTAADAVVERLRFNIDLGVAGLGHGGTLPDDALFVN